MYYVDLGYDFVEDDNVTLTFDNISNARDFTEEVRKRTGEILAITENDI